MKIIDGKMFRQMIVTGATVLHNNHPEIDALNVFPVPDGDTGTNMSLTFTSGATEVERLQSERVDEIAKTLSKGLLMGARGNSGVILSQIFRGVSKSLKGKETANANDLADAFMQGSKVAYKAVMKPTEGTILTVIRESAEAAKAYVTEDMEIEDYFSYFVKAANESLDRTPELLPVLKEVGVVDSGGAGLLLVLTGFMSALAGEEIERVDINEEEVKNQQALERAEKAGIKANFGYRTEFMLDIAEGKESAFNAENFQNELERIPGERITIVQDGNIVRAKLYTKKPGNALNIAQRFGEFLTVDIENPNAKDVEKKEIVEEVPEKDIAVISVAAGSGIKATFEELHCDHVVSGGQTMNPATEDLVKAIRGVHAKHVIVLPNNSNIVMTAQQAATVLEDEIDVIVIPTKTIPQGLSACIMFNPEASLEDNVSEMKDAMGNVKTGQVTFAVRDTNIDGVEVTANQYMALCNKTITACVPEKMDALKKSLEGLVDDDSEIITLICGEDVTDEEKEEAQAYIEETYEDAELEMIDGLQPVYSFIVGVE
ncbi:MAG: DAK2 domain-containing protein [Kandleria vitulina]|uniref:DAK2 domain-containing protein n=1 Tax=Kandleria vitulina TaxID=1630 RepID=UPI002E79FDE2|nr:DAK2 domain-containing protein [Kandleria vitulina]MEE0988570.1 DAK2 domain-containing protein [Kandleria vitulina]